MNYLKSFVKGTEDGMPSGAETVARLCERISLSTLLDDRRDAVRALKSLSRKYCMDVGSQALPHLIEILRTDSNDEMTGYALEALFNLTTTDANEEGDMIPQPEITAMFVEKFIETQENVILVLNLITKYDFSVRWAALRLLTSLLRGRPNEVQQIVLVVPMGISTIIDLLVENREVIRNDALLALIALTRGNPNIQKIVAFENGFESLFNIIHEEGLSDGGIVVEDCLLLLLHLLKNNTSNQQLFKEGSLIQRLTPFFDIDIEGAWSTQKNVNFLLMLKVIRILVSPSNPSNLTSSCQLVMQHCFLLKNLTDLLMATGVPTDVLTEGPLPNEENVIHSLCKLMSCILKDTSTVKKHLTLLWTINTVSELLRGCNENQLYFTSVMAPWDPPRPALVVLLMSMVNGQQPFALRCSVLYCFQCFLHKYAIGQSQTVNTLLPSSLEPQDVSVGQLLCGGLFSVSDPLTNWLSAIALSHTLRSNNEAKRQLLRVQVATTPGSSPVTLLKQITNIMQQTTYLQTRIGLLCLLCGWLTDCPVAVSHFLGSSSSVSYLLSQIAENGTDLDFVMHGICALLIGICIIDNDGSVQQYSKESLIELIVAGVGIERFCDALMCVQQHDLYSRALQKPQLTADNPEHILLDHTFVLLFKALKDTIIKTVSNLEDVKREEEEKAALKAHDSIVTQYKTLIKEQDVELADAKCKYEKLEADFKTITSSLTERDAQVQQLKDQLNLMKASQASTGDISATIFIERIEDLNQKISKKDSELTACQQTIAELKAQCSVKDEYHTTNGYSQNEMSLLQEKIDKLSIELQEKENQLSKQQPINGDIHTEETVRMQQKLKDSDETIENLEKVLAERVAQLIESKSVCEMIQREHDEILILVSDQGEKVSLYKKKLQDLGAEVSSDDDLEDDDLEDISTE